MTHTRRHILMAAGALSLALMRPAFAQEFPSKPIKIIVPASAGTSIDGMARFFSGQLSKRLNTPVVVANMGGAGGLLGYMEAKKAAPDGYTLILTGIPMYLLPLLSELPVPPFDPLKDFAPVARGARVAFAIVVSADSPYQSLSDLIQAMKNKPGDLTYSSQGVGSAAQLCSALLTDMSKTKALHIGYKETTTAVTDVVAGRVSFTCQTSTGVLPLLEGKKLRALAVTGTKRWDALPDVPTVAEAGVPGFEVSSQLDVMAPGQTPQAVRRLLSEHITQIAKTPQFKEFCAKQVLAVDVLDFEALVPEMASSAVKWKSIAQLVR